MNTQHFKMHLSQHKCFKMYSNTVFDHQLGQIKNLNKCLSKPHTVLQCKIKLINAQQKGFTKTLLLCYPGIRVVVDEVPSCPPPLTLGVSGLAGQTQLSCLWVGSWLGGNAHHNHLGIHQLGGTETEFYWQDYRSHFLRIFLISE